MNVTCTSKEKTTAPTNNVVMYRACISNCTLTMSTTRNWTAEPKMTFQKRIQNEQQNEQQNALLNRESTHNFNTSKKTSKKKSNRHTLIHLHAVRDVGNEIGHDRMDETQHQPPTTDGH